MRAGYEVQKASLGKGHTVTRDTEQRLRQLYVTMGEPERAAQLE